MIAQNCPDVLLQFEESFIDGSCSERQDIQWVWTAVDECENVSVETSTVVFSSSIPQGPENNSCEEDFNSDGQVNSSDLLILLADFGCSQGACAGDLNNDGQTNASDLLSFFGAFGAICD